MEPPELAHLLKTGLHLETEVQKIPSHWGDTNPSHRVTIKIRYEGLMVAETEFTIDNDE